MSARRCSSASSPLDQATSRSRRRRSRALHDRGKTDCESRSAVQQPECFRPCYPFSSARATLVSEARLLPLAETEPRRATRRRKQCGALLERRRLAAVEAKYEVRHRDDGIEGWRPRHERPTRGLLEGFAQLLCRARSPVSNLLSRNRAGKGEADEANLRPRGLAAPDARSASAVAALSLSRSSGHLCSARHAR